MPYPVRSLFIWPSDMPPLYKPKDAARLAGAWQVACRDWWTRQTGWTYDLHHQLLMTKMTRAQLGGHQEGAHYNEQRNPTTGQGLHTTSVHEAIEAARLFTMQHRLTAVVANGGGYAGGNQDAAPFAYGYAIFGDWFIYHALTGKADPGCLNGYGEDFCTLSDGTPGWDGLLHEQGHMWGIMWDHKPVYVNWKAKLAPEQIDAFGAQNKAFIYRPEGSNRRVWVMAG